MRRHTLSLLMLSAVFVAVAVLPARQSARVEIRVNTAARIAAPGPVAVQDGRVRVPFTLERQGVSLVTLTW
jgi:hypothetical protein